MIRLSILIERSLPGGVVVVGAHLAGVLIARTGSVLAFPNRARTSIAKRLDIFGDFSNENFENFPNVKNLS
jgi:hypothetical protein